MKIKEIMSTPVHTVRLETPTGDIARMLTDLRIGVVPVIDGGGTAVGLVSERDLIDRAGPTAEHVMSRGVVSITEDTDVDHVRHLLVDRGIRRVPVMSGGHVVGIVSRWDLVSLIALEWGCDVCGTQVRGERAPHSCPTCGANEVRFSRQQQQPGA
jgi:CBS domain-containing protein